jgi:hypothetical protein
MRFATLTLLFSAVCVHASPAHHAQSAQRDACIVSPIVRDSPPPDARADPAGPANWYVNPDRTIWAGPVPDEGWRPGGTLYSGGRVVRGQKTYWVRPQGAALVIDGRRLDATAPPVETDIPCCYPSGFQIVGLFFPTEGCWEVTAQAGTSRLDFVTRVRMPAAGRQP